MESSLKQTVQQVVLSSSEKTCPICGGKPDTRDIYLSMYSITGNRTIKIAYKIPYCNCCGIYFSTYQIVHQLSMIHQKCRVYTYSLNTIGQLVPLVEDAFLVQEESKCPNCGTAATRMPVHVLADTSNGKITQIKCCLPYCYRCGYFFASKKTIQKIEQNCVPYKIKTINPDFIAYHSPNKQAIKPLRTEGIPTQNRSINKEPQKDQNIGRSTRLGITTKEASSKRCLFKGCNGVVFRQGLCWEHYKHDRYEVK